MPVNPSYHALVIGSGVGGAAAAHALVESGLRVLMIERGPRVRRGLGNWAADAVMELSPYYSTEDPWEVRGDDPGRVGSFRCVGGPAVFYGAVALRLREHDFLHDPGIVGDSGARWPYGYDELEAYYAWAETLLEVGGDDTGDPSAPPRSGPYPRTPLPPRGPARKVWAAAGALGLTPSLLPLAIRHGEAEGQGPGESCALCGTCDGYACAIQAKREPSTAILPHLEGRGLTLRPETEAVRLLRRGGRVVGVECVDSRTGRPWVARADHYVLAAGALASPRLILASGLHCCSPARDWVGRCLMRHCNGVVMGLFPQPLEGARSFHKQVGIFGLYGGRDGAPKLGCIQSIHPPPPGLVRDRVPRWLGGIAEPLADRSTGLLVIAEDQPRRENRVEADPRRSDRFGMPVGRVTHRYTWRDAHARLALAEVARAVLRGAGASVTQSARIRTFSHAVGTLRMGVDPRTSPLDASSRFRGVENLWVTDGSFMPRSGGVNPSLTIAANALKAGVHLAGTAVPDRFALRRRDREALPETAGGVR
jgi:choline dehydrogenase-like flavoprotein